MESKDLMVIKYVTDTDTDTEMYKMGELQSGATTKENLVNYIKTYGIDDLLKEITHLAYQVWETKRCIEVEKESEPLLK